jgi:AraC-like DNA-binding protein/mannose-6-phosphate isomerase-like protein (cupin superfamily)
MGYWYASKPVTVHARPADNSILPATAGEEAVAAVEVRFDRRIRAGTIAFAGEDFATGWHRHDLHQVEYAFEGVVQVETRSARYLLPPQQAVWIPAGVAHNTSFRRVRTISAFFDPATFGDGGDRARILAVAPVIRELLLYAQRWPIGRVETDADADSVFDALARIVAGSLEHEMPLALPTTSDPIIAEAMAYTDEHLRGATAASVGRAVGLSERSLRRHFTAATGMTWRRYLLQSRLLRAMAMLTGGNRTVLEIATAVGFDSVSAFTRAFRSLTGETPSAYRRRGER